MSRHPAQVTSAAPLATIVVPSYNYGRYLGECLDGIFGQRVRDFEVIVIDDGSTDDTARVFKEGHRSLLALSTTDSRFHEVSTPMISIARTFLKK